LQVDFVVRCLEPTTCDFEASASMKFKLGVVVFRSYHR